MVIDTEGSVPGIDISKDAIDSVLGRRMGFVQGDVSQRGFSSHRSSLLRSGQEKTLGARKPVEDRWRPNALIREIELVGAIGNGCSGEVAHDLADHLVGGQVGAGDRRIAAELLNEGIRSAFVRQR